MKYKIGMVSLGCAKNLVDTETMLGLLNEQKFRITTDEESADIIIINTCAFIEDAKTESIETIVEMAEYKNKGNCKLLIVTGCLAQRYKEEILKEIPEVDCIVGTNKYHEIVNIINNAMVSDKKIIECGYDDNVLDMPLPRYLSTPPYTAYLKIAEGCDNCCTYCIIPEIRGKYKSRKFEDIIEEAYTLASNGVKELIIIAQDTTNYGFDLYGSYRLPELLKELCELRGIEWIRLHYCYPERVSDELIDVVSKELKICNYFDIPLQHISNNILNKMGRNITSEEINKLIYKIRSKIPNVVLRTSLIVGFPGETDSDYNELLSFVRNVQFDRVGVFAYSREEGTPAYNFDNQVERSIVEKRYNKLMGLQEKITKKINQTRLYKRYVVLVEGYNAKTEAYFGRTYADSPDVDCRIYFYSKNILKLGDFVRVDVSDVVDYDLLGACSDEFRK